MNIPTLTIEKAGVWTGVAVSALTLLGRLFARFRGMHRLYWDDVSVIAAFILVVITGALWQWGAPAMYYVLNVQAGLELYDQTRFFPDMKRWLLVSLIVELFFYTSLLLIKLAFILFFKRLGQRIKFFKWIWWPVLVVTLGSYFGSVGNVDYKCLIAPVETILQECNTASSIGFVVTTLKANCALDIFTDFLSKNYPPYTFPVL
ncbi:hypothetical protein PFICI_04007 [Pestalotiopsis fici W106-1]|uniref:Rhodopsin domain-containing protein n=1 Tax=Pestalotiopsis fici (strain W106-1 / CGMCC3.15140) TaxID=1229662 RepID=W3XKI8_PESFW|nr:uncharacterized protein PFICI_04007 [Pestalotiopsis fici W106-1]ETS85982.1 hypothetical protein PFICI_04007 [Pestalotiopsis fici W106-1]